MNVDHYFTIGSDHQARGVPCEDYALSGTTPSGLAYGVVADGCSGAQAHTDIGARALAWAFKTALQQRQVAPSEWLRLGFSELLKTTFANLQYTGTSEDYLATIVGFSATADRASAYVHGDGAVALRYADGRFRLLSFQWLDNMPFYLNYKLHVPHLDEFLRRYQFGILEPFTQTDTTFKVSAGGLEIMSSETTRFSVDEVFNGHVLDFRPKEEGIVALAVLTDGIEQVGDQPPTAVAAELLAFKTTLGDFAKRRAMRMLKTLARDGVVPRDDLGMAAVWFGEEG